MEKYKKKYLTVQELVMAAIRRASEDSLYKDALERCSLEYSMVPTAAEKDEVQLCSFDTIGHAEYGSNEGIYGIIEFRGLWNNRQKDGNGSRAKDVFVAKTLGITKDAYLGMSMMMALISFHLDEFVRENLSRFD